MTTFCMALQFWKQYEPMLFVAFGITISANDVQPENVNFPMLFTTLGRSIPGKAAHP